MEVSGFCVCKFFKVQFYVILHMNHGKTTFKKLVFGYEHKNHTSNLPTYRFGDVRNLYVECPYLLSRHSARCEPCMKCRWKNEHSLHECSMKKGNKQIPPNIINYRIPSLGRA